MPDDRAEDDKGRRAESDREDKDDASDLEDREDGDGDEGRVQAGV